MLGREPLPPPPPPPTLLLPMPLPSPVVPLVVVPFALPAVVAPPALRLPKPKLGCARELGLNVRAARVCGIVQGGEGRRGEARRGGTRKGQKGRRVEVTRRAAVSRTCPTE